MTRDERRLYMATYNRAYYAARREQELARVNAYNAAHRHEKLTYSEQYAAGHVEERRAYRLARYTAHIDRLRADARKYHTANRAERLAASARWRKANRGIVNAIGMRRTAAKLRATPIWADLDAIRAIYVEAARLTRETGIPHDVDHIYPLQSRLVCGLHVACNLQILTKIENTRKHNKLPQCA